MNGGPFLETTSPTTMRQRIDTMRYIVRAARARRLRRWLRRHDARTIDTRNALTHNDPANDHSPYRVVLIENAYQHARTGTKAWVRVLGGPRWDAWFENVTVNTGELHLIEPYQDYGPHNQHQILYARTFGTITQDELKCARRFQRREAKLARLERFDVDETVSFQLDY